MLSRLRKFLVASANLVLLWLMFKLVTGQLDWGLALGSILLSAFWLGLTTLSLRGLFTTYYDKMSRLRIQLPLISGVILAVVALFANDSIVLRSIAGAELLAWLVLYFAWRRNATAFLTTPHGLLPLGTWVNPPVDVLKPGYMVLTSGAMARRMKQALGHGEVVVRGDDGKLKLFSAYMPNGTVINKADQLLRIWPRKGEHYVVLRLKQPLTEEQIQRGWLIAQGMLSENKIWREEANTKRQAFIARLWLPQSWRTWLDKKSAFTTTGYDWLGLFIGFKAKNRWTCVGACAEWYGRNRLKMRHYGTGLLGIGTGILDPIQPQRYLDDPAFELLTDTDRREWESTSTGAEK